MTLLALTRDAVARLPNGRGTRGDVCGLVRQSQFLAPVVTDNQVFKCAIFVQSGVH